MKRQESPEGNNSSTILSGQTSWARKTSNNFYLNCDFLEPQDSPCKIAFKSRFHVPRAVPLPLTKATWIEACRIHVGSEVHTLSLLPEQEAILIGRIFFQERVYYLNNGPFV